MASMRMAAGQHSSCAMMWIERLPAAVTTASLAGLHRSERHLLVLPTLLGVTTAATSLRLHRLTATATESELAQSLLYKPGDKVRHFWFI
jgi:hypothetical protein